MPDRSRLPGGAATDDDVAGPVLDDALDVIDRRQVRTLFQPIVSLPVREVVGYEALSRGPAGSPVESPLALLAAARRAGRLAELDWLFLASACDAARRGRLHPSTSLFCNVAPSTLLRRPPEDLRAATLHGKRQLRIFVEVKEDSLLEDPGTTLDALQEVRRLGWGIAVDNASVDASSLSLFPLVEPDVVKIDLRAVRGDIEALAAMSDGARLYREQSGASILVESIEHGDDLRSALAAGAQLGQGWHLGVPGELRPHAPGPREVVPMLDRPPARALARPLDLVAKHLDPAATEHRFLYPLARHLVEQTLSNGPPALLLASYSGFTLPAPDDVPRLLRAVRGAAYAVILGPRLDPALQPTPNGSRRVRHLSNDGNLHGDWNIVVLGPHYAGALLARDLGEHGPPDRRRFTFVITHDRELVLGAARSFLQLAGGPTVSGHSDVVRSEDNVTEIGLGPGSRTSSG